MKKFRYFFLLSSYFLLLISCKNNNHVSESKIETTQKLEIVHLQETYFTNIYVINNYTDNEQCIKYIFAFAKNNKGSIDILTDKNIFKIEDGALIGIDKTKQRFYFEKIKEGNIYNDIKVNFLENIPVHFTTKETDNQTDLTANFEILTVNTIQNFLDYIKKDETKKESETYTYMLFNKNNQEKIKLIYHEYGEWFEIDIL